MTHKSSHVIVNKLTQTVTFSEDANPEKSKVRVWWFLALPVVTFFVGLAF